MSADGQRGFTLMEILVALLIVSVALGATIKAATEQTASLTHLRDKTVAHWVAMNRIVELQTPRQGSGSLRKNGSEEQMGREWYWRVKLTSTQVEEIQRLDVEVRLEPTDENPLVTRTAYVRKR
jgi:general secretion pathway protein I